MLGAHVGPRRMISAFTTRYTTFMKQSPATLFRGLFETHLHVANLEAAMRFYGDVIGLELGLMESERRAAFYWVGEDRSTMLGLWEKPPWIAPETGNSPQIQHIAFAVSFEDLQEAIQHLQQNGIVLRNFFDQNTDEPSVLAWMPAASIYFNDLDGHLLEFIAMLDSEPAPDIGVVSLSEWNNLRKQNQGNATRKA